MGSVVSARRLSLGRSRVALVVTLVAALTTGVVSVAPAHAAPATTTSQVQIWNINIRQIARNWQSFIERMAAEPLQPDVILVQELCNCDREDAGSANDLSQFMAALNNRFSPTSYSFATGSPLGDFTDGTNVVIWRSGRFTEAGVRRWSGREGDACDQVDKRKTVAVRLLDNLQPGRYLVAVSLHLNTRLSEECVSTNIGNTHMEVRDWTFGNTTVIGGDFNQRPQMDPEPQLATEGVETDPDCWYRRFARSHENTRLAGTNCGGWMQDKYLDVVWQVQGGFSNPAPPSFCQQYTHRPERAFAVPNGDVANSCTDLDNDGKLDAGRIDHIFVSWGWSSGVGDPTVVSMWGPTAVPFVHSAGVDLGANPSAADSYSDHRGVYALISYYSPTT